jgi:hypothetical protein
MSLPGSDFASQIEQLLHDQSTDVQQAEELVAHVKEMPGS